MKNDKLIKDMFWMAYRYCIGRHSYVCSYASDFFHYMKNILTDDEAEFDAFDIRENILSHLNLEFNFKMDSNDMRDNHIDPIDAFVEMYNKYGFEPYGYQYPNKVSEKNRNEEEINTANNKLLGITDLICWDDIAKGFDKKSHYLVKTDKYGEFTCIKKVEFISSEKKFDYCYVDINNIGKYSSINKDCIVSVKKKYE